MRTIITSILLACAATASAQPNANLPQNRQPQTEERYQPRNRLANVRLDADRGRSYIQLPRTGRRLDYLELRAGRTRINILDVEVRFADGRVIHTGDRGIMEPFEGRVIDLPRNAAPVVAIVPHYRTLGRRDVARLEIYGVPERVAYRRYR